MFINNQFVPMGNTGLSHVVIENLDLLKSFYYAGCGYHNFSQVFSTIACKYTGRKDDDLNWDGYNEVWAKQSQYTKKDYALIILYNADGLDKRVNDLTELLDTLCEN